MAAPAIDGFGPRAYNHIIFQLIRYLKKGEEMPEPKVIRPKEQLPRDLDPQGRRPLQLFRDTVGGKDVGLNYVEWEPGASNGPHTRTKDEMIFALHGKGEV